MAEEKKSLRCSFCGKSEGQVHRMIQGPGVRICDECVQLCMSILDDGYSAAMDEGFDSVEDLPLSLIHISVERYMPDLSPDFLRIRRRAVLDAEGRDFR